MSGANETRYLIIQKYGDRDKEGGYSVRDYAHTIPANPMSDRGQMVMELMLMINRYGNFGPGGDYSVHDYSSCVNTTPSSNKGHMVCEGELMGDKKYKYRIRKLTPKECCKLQGLRSEDDDAMAAVGISNSKRYQCYGNGIITNCVQFVMEHVFKAQFNRYYECTDEKFIREHSGNMISDEPKKAPKMGDHVEEWSAEQEKLRRERYDEYVHECELLCDDAMSYKEWCKTEDEDFL